MHTYWEQEQEDLAAYLCFGHGSDGRGRGGGGGCCWIRRREQEPRARRRGRQRSPAATAPGLFFSPSLSLLLPSSISFLSCKNLAGVEDNLLWLLGLSGYGLYLLSVRGKQKPQVIL